MRWPLGLPRTDALMNHARRGLIAVQLYNVCSGGSGGGGGGEKVVYGSYDAYIVDT